MNYREKGKLRKRSKYKRRLIHENHLKMINRWEHKVNESYKKEMNKTAVIINFMINSVKNKIPLTKEFYNLCNESCHRGDRICSRAYRVTLYLNKEYEKVNKYENMVLPRNYPKD